MVEILRMITIIVMKIKC